MVKITLSRAKDVDDEQLRELEEKIKFVFPFVVRAYVMGNLMGIEKGNWSKYMSGEYPITPNIILEFDVVFRNILKQREKAFSPNTGGSYLSSEGTSPYKEIEIKLTELSTDSKLIAAGQERLEEKIDEFLQKKS